MFTLFCLLSTLADGIKAPSRLLLTSMPRSRQAPAACSKASTRLISSLASLLSILCKRGTLEFPAAPRLKPLARVWSFGPPSPPPNLAPEKIAPGSPALFIDQGYFPFAF